MDIPGASSAAGEESSGVVLGHQRTSSQELSPDTPLVGTQPAALVAPVAVQQDQDQEVQEESAPGGKTRFMTADEKRRAMHLLFQGVSARKVAKILGRGHSAISALRGRVLSGHNIEEKRKSPRKKVWDNIDFQLKLKNIMHRTQGQITYMKLAEHMEVSVGTMHGACKALGWFKQSKEQGFRHYDVSPFDAGPSGEASHPHPIPHAPPHPHDHAHPHPEDAGMAHVAAGSPLTPAQEAVLAAYVSGPLTAYPPQPHPIVHTGLPVHPHASHPVPIAHPLHPHPHTHGHAHAHAHRHAHAHAHAPPPMHAQHPHPHHHGGPPTLPPMHPAAAYHHHARHGTGGGIPGPQDHHTH